MKICFRKESFKSCEGKSQSVIISAIKNFICQLLQFYFTWLSVSWYSPYHRSNRPPDLVRNWCQRSLFPNQRIDVHIRPQLGIETAHSGAIYHNLEKLQLTQHLFQAHLMLSCQISGCTSLKIQQRGPLGNNSTKNLSSYKLITMRIMDVSVVPYPPK